MDVIRTPDDRFAGLPGFPFAPHYVEVADGDGGTLRVHYLDEGPRDAPVVLLMHGEPSWCFLYRKMIPVLTAAGLACVAPDLVGFGRSDKPTARTDYTYARHVEWMRAALFDALDLRDVTLVGQDWGGLIGLRLVGEHPDRFARVVAANTFLPTGDTPPGEAFLAWQQLLADRRGLRRRRHRQQRVHDRPRRRRGRRVRRAVPRRHLQGRRAPVPDARADHPRRSRGRGQPRGVGDAARRSTKPFLTAFSDEDAITRGGDRVFQRDVPGCAGQPHTTIDGGGHFLQEDRGEELARVVADWIVKG